MGGRYRVTLSAAALTAFCACVKHLPPAPKPDAVMPAVALPSTPPAPGHSRLVVDVVDGPAPVTRGRFETTPIDAGNGRTKFRFDSRLDVACPSTPCVLELPIGNTVLGFPYINDLETFETELVHVGPEPAVYRKALSYAAPGPRGLKVGGILALTFGGMSAVVGAVFLPIGLADDRSGFVTAGAITLGVGAALIGFGTWAVVRSTSVYRDGASSHFRLQP